MSRAAWAFFSAGLAGCAAAPEGAPTARPPAAGALAPAPAVRPIALRNAGFEDPMTADRRCAPGWDCTMHSDPTSFRFFAHEEAVEGRRSFCVERVRDEPWALVTQAFDGPAVRSGARLRLSMAVRLEGVTGAGAGPWALVQGAPPINPQQLVRGTGGWRRLSVDVTVPPGRHVVEVGAALEGPGRACFDDVRLEVLPAG